MTKPSDNAIRFEAVKVAMNQTRDGYKLVLALHPHEVPEEMLRSLVGTRYVLAAVELNDDDTIKEIKREPGDPGAEAVRYAAMLCRDPVFQRWMFRKGFAAAPDEAEAAMGLRAVLDIASRSELATDEQKRKDLYEFAQRYLDGR